MNILFHLGHPAHFHLFKNVIKSLKNSGHKIYVLIKKKDVLEDLLLDSKIEYINILPNGRKNSKLGIAIGQIKQLLRLLRFCLSNKPDLLIGSTPTVAQVARLIGSYSISLSEDDASEVSFFAKTTYPFTNVILSPDSCDNGKWNNKTVKYNSYHELAYLHPNHFSPDFSIVKKYDLIERSFFLIRLSSLNAYHDTGISGINTAITRKIIALLNPHGKVLITSERKLPESLEKYRIKINSKDVHHFLSYAKIYIGDSQTMAAEAGVLGTPFIRVNDFVGRLGYLNELENRYKLGVGCKPNNQEGLIEEIMKLLAIKDLSLEWQKRRDIMLSDKMDFNKFLFNYIINSKH